MRPKIDDGTEFLQIDNLGNIASSIRLRLEINDTNKTIYDFFYSENNGEDYFTLGGMDIELIELESNTQLVIMDNT